MYFIDLFKTIFRKANFAAIIYLILNIFLFSIIINLLFELPFATSLLYGLLLYSVSLFIALSPIGESIVRMQTNCKKIKRVDIQNRIVPLFNEVYSKTVAGKNTISRNIKIFYNEDEAPNAFAVGRNTICVTKGLLNLPDMQIKAILGHEFGHLANKDTNLILLVTVGNMFINIFVVGAKLFIKIIYLFLYLFAIIIDSTTRNDRDRSGGFFCTLVTHLSKILTMLLVNTVVNLWTKLGTLLVMKSSRSAEYEADEFSFRLSVNYGNALCRFLDDNCGEPSTSLFANLMSSHPSSDLRIAKLQSLGATYRRKYGDNNA